MFENSFEKLKNSWPNIMKTLFYVSGIYTLLLRTLHKLLLQR